MDERGDFCGGSFDSIACVSVECWRYFKLDFWLYSVDMLWGVTKVD